MLESEEKGYNSDTITSQPFRLSKRWKKKFEPNTDLMDNHLINHNLINHNLSRISGNSKEDSSTAVKSESIESDLDIRTLEQANNLQHKMQSFKSAFKPECPDFEPVSDCPFSCCVFLCLLAKHNRSKKKSEKRRQKGDKKSLKHSTNSIHSNCNTTASTLPEDEYHKNPTRSTSRTDLNHQDSNERINLNTPDIPDISTDCKSGNSTDYTLENSPDCKPENFTMSTPVQSYPLQEQLTSQPSFPLNKNTQV